METSCISQKTSIRSYVAPGKRSYLQPPHIQFCSGCYGSSIFTRDYRAHQKEKKKKERKMSTHKALPFYKDSTQRLFGV